jgi:toxin ParE1/3/4
VTAKPVVPRERARRDVEEAIDYYAQEVGAAGVALRFVDAVRQAYRAISVRPATGLPRHAHELDLPGLRARKLNRSPYLVFYLEQDEHIDAWRLLHAQRDIPSWMAD